MNDDQKAFLAKINAGPWDDEVARHIYADWLLEHDQPEEAERQRKYVPAVRWLKGMVKEIKDDYYKDLDESIPFSYDGIIEVGWNIVCGEDDGYVFGSSKGRDFFAIEGNKETFFKNWSIVTGAGVVDEDVVKNSYFGCSC